MGRLERTGVFTLGFLAGGISMIFVPSCMDDKVQYNKVIPLSEIVSPELAKFADKKTQTISSTQAVEAIKKYFDRNGDGQITGAEHDLVLKELQRLAYFGGRHRNIVESFKNLKAAATIMGDRDYMQPKNKNLKIPLPW